MVWPIMGDACRRSIHLKDGVEASQRVRSSVSLQNENVRFEQSRNVRFRVRSSGRSAPSSTLAFNEQSGNCSGPEVLLKQSTAPTAGSLVPETCHNLRTLANLVADQVRQAKADFPLVLRARIKAWLRYWRSLVWWQMRLIRPPL